MPLATDILFYLTGGTGNTDPNASLGGVISTTQVSATALHNLFHYVSPEAATGGEATTVSSGINLTVNIAASIGIITGVTVNVGGTGYAVGDNVFVNTGTTPLSAVLKVAAVSAGVVTSIAILTGGTGYTTGTGVATTAGATAPYRAIDVKNTSANTYYAPMIYISSPTPLAATYISIGYEAGTQTIVNEYTAPTGITFSREDVATSKATGVSLGGDMASGATKRIWLRRTITAGVGMSASDAFTLSISGGSAV